MRRGRREKINDNRYFKRLIFTTGGILLVIIATFVITFIVYNNKLKDYNYSSLSTEQIADLVPNEGVFNNTVDYVEEASSDIGKSIEEAINTVEEEKAEEKEEKETTKEKAKETKSKEQTKEVKQTNTEPEKVKDPEFVMPVEGKILRGFAKDSLIYSETLEEWITHLAIDIKADRTAVVSAAEAGTVKSIKNDPRYGLSIVIEHVNGFETIYSNLLTTEFVEEGQKVEKGQSIGTVGNSAAFEIVDEPHLHFEIIKDGENVDPTIYIK